MRRVFPRFVGLETAPVEWTLVIILSDGLVKHHRTPFLLNYHGSLLFTMIELLLNISLVPCCFLAGDRGAPCPPLRSREDQVSGPLDLSEHIDGVLLLHLDSGGHLIRTINVQVRIYVLVLSLVMLRGKCDGPVVG